MKKMLKWSLQAGKIAEGSKMVSRTTLLSSTVWIKGLLHMLHLHLELLQRFHFTKHPAFTASQHRRQRSSKDSWYIHRVRNTPLHLVTFSSGASVLSNLKIVIFRAVGMTFWCKTRVFEISPPSTSSNSTSIRTGFSPLDAGDAFVHPVSKNSLSRLLAPWWVSLLLCPPDCPADKRFTYTFPLLPSLMSCLVAAP